RVDEHARPDSVLARHRSIDAQGPREGVLSRVSDQGTRRAGYADRGIHDAIYGRHARARTAVHETARTVPDDQSRIERRDPRHRQAGVEGVDAQLRYGRRSVAAYGTSRNAAIVSAPPTDNSTT